MTEARQYPSQVSITGPFLKNILDAAPVGLIVFDHEARVIYANTLAEQIFGTSANTDDVQKFGGFIACPHRHTDAQGCGHTDHCPSCPIFRAIRAVGEKEPNAADLEGEALLLRQPDQSDLWVKFKVNDIPMGDRKAAIMTIDDITDRKRTEKAVRDSDQDIIGRKLSEDALRESEKKYREIFENAPVGIFQTTPQGRFLSANPEYARMAGYPTPSEMIAQISDISTQLYVRPEERKRYRELLHRQGQVTNYEVELRRRDGSTFWVSMNTKALENQGGEIVYDGFLTDVTERVRVEQALRNAEARQRAMIANIADVIAIIDQGGIIRFKSANIEKWFGWRSEDLLGTLGWDNVHPEDLDGALKMYAELLAEPNGTRSLESRYRCKDGTYKWTSFAAVNLLHNPDIKGFLINYRDITESKRAKEALMESESRLALAMDAVSDGIWDWRVDTGKVYYSPRWYLMLGYEPYELPQAFETWQKLLHPDDRSRAEQNIAKYLETTEPFEMEFRMSTRQGGWKWILARGKTVERNRDGKARRMLGTHVDITERRQAEDALRESERHLQKVFDILPVGLWFADKDGTLLKGNPAGIKIWGAQPLVDPSSYGIFKARRFPSGEEIAPSEWSLYHTIRDGVTIVDELLEIDAFDGEKRVILNSTAPVLDDQGNVQGAIVVNQDITARQRAEADLKRIEWMLSKKPASTVSGGQVVHDQGYGDLTELNRHGTILKLIGPELLASFANDYLELLGTSSAIYEANGDYAFGIFASGWCRMMDRASRKLCDTPDNVKALQSGKWLCHESCWTHCAKQAIANRTPMDIACHGGIRLYGVPILANGQVAGVINFGYADPPKDPAHLQQLAKAYHLDYDDLVREARAYDSRPPYIIEMAKSRLHASARLIGSILEAKLAETARQKLQDQLNQAQKMESVGRLAGGVAHDYNNMLSVIIGYTEMAMDKMQPDDPLHADLAEIFKAARRSIDITRQLLAFARKQTIAPKVVDLNTIVESMLRMLGRLIGEDIDLAWMPGKQLWSVKIDPAQIDQILANLCVNARDAIGGVGKVTIETGNTTFDDAYCELHAGFLPGEFVLLAISDNGCGMDDQIVKNIFEPFFTTKRVAEGTGLGLATVYGIVKQNNGFINVYSEPGSGTTFRIYLPRHVGQQHPMRAATKIQTPMGRGEMVLLVEDEPSIMRMAKMMLKRLGYQVLAAGSPRQALALAEQHAGALDLLITDVVMPEMSGRSLANQIHGLYPSIKTLFMSGYTANVIAHNGVLDEGVNFIQKPFSLNDLAIKIRSVLKE
jgi:PAS domain S-box-containing protein